MGNKVIITADPHFGVQGKTQDILWSCRVMREYAKYANIDTVLVLGDLFHDRRSIGIDILNVACKFFLETQEEYEQNWIAFPGNHDMFLRYSWDINSIMPLQKYMTIIQDVKILQLEEQRFWIIPFITYEKSFMTVLKAVEKQAEPDDILLTHVGIRGATLNTCFMLKDWSIVSFEYSKFKRIYTGHFHTKQQIGENVWYPGSPIPFKFDEGGVGHGFYVYDLDEKTHHFINIWKAGQRFFPNEIPPPQFYTITEDQITTMMVEDVKHNNIRIMLTSDFTIEQKRDISEEYKRNGARIVRFSNLAQTKKEEVKDIQPSSSMTHKNIFMNWVENDAGAKNLDRDILKRINDDVIHEGDEAYVVEESDIV